MTQLVQLRTGIAEVKGSTTGIALNFFFQAKKTQLLKLLSQCEGHFIHFNISTVLGARPLPVDKIFLLIFDNFLMIFVSTGQSKGQPRGTLS